MKPPSKRPRPTLVSWRRFLAPLLPALLCVLGTLGTGCAVTTAAPRTMGHALLDSRSDVGAPGEAPIGALGGSAGTPREAVF